MKHFCFQDCCFLFIPSHAQSSKSAAHVCLVCHRCSLCPVPIHFHLMLIEIHWISGWLHFPSFFRYLFNFWRSFQYSLRHLFSRGPNKQNACSVAFKNNLIPRMNLQNRSWNAFFNFTQKTWQFQLPAPLVPSVLQANAKRHGFWSSGEDETVWTPMLDTAGISWWLHSTERFCAEHGRPCSSGRSFAGLVCTNVHDGFCMVLCWEVSRKQIVLEKQVQ